MRKQQNDLSAQQRLRSAWASAQSSLCSQWVTKDLSFIPADSEDSDQTSEDSDQTGRMPRLIRVFAGFTSFLLFLSCTGSNDLCDQQRHRSAWAFSLAVRPSLISLCCPPVERFCHWLHIKHTSKTDSQCMTKPTECPVCPAKTQISLGIRPV